MAEYDEHKYLPNGDYDPDGEGVFDDSLITSEDCWTVINSFFKSKGLVSNQLESYNYFAQNGIQEIIEEKGSIILDYAESYDESEPNPVVIRRHEVQFGKVYIAPPAITEGDGMAEPLYPHQARLRSLTYAAPIYCNMTKKTHVAREHPTDENSEGTLKEDGTELFWEELPTEPDDVHLGVYIGRLPIMLKSAACPLNDVDKFPDEDLYAWGECPFDQGGYFIINGSEKVLIAQERSAGNIVQVFQKPAQSAFSWIAEIRSVINKGLQQMSQCTVKLYRRAEGPEGQKLFNVLRVQLPHIKQDIPLVIVFRALGVVSDSDIITKICFNTHEHKEIMEMLMPSLQEGQLFQEVDVAKEWIAKRGGVPTMRPFERVKYTTDILQKEWLPHIGKGPDATTRKAYFLGYMVNRLLKCALGQSEQDDRDHLARKRLDLAGPLMAQLFRSLFDKSCKDYYRYMQKTVEAGRPIRLTMWKPGIITNGLKYSLATGNWGDQKKLDKAKAGVSQVLNRYAYASTLSHLRRTNAPIGREGKIAKPRQLHNTHWGYVCPAETPEGQACGLVKNLALMAMVSNFDPTDPIKTFLMRKEGQVETLEDWEPQMNSHATKVFLDGVWWFVINDNPKSIVDQVKQLRRKGTLGSNVSMVWDIREKEFRITGEAGRITRPLFIVETDRAKENWGKLRLTKEDIQALENGEAFRAAPDSMPEGAEMYGWQDLVDKGIVEHLDAEEEETAMIIMTPEALEDAHSRHMGMDVITDNPDPLSRNDPPLNPFTDTFTHCEIHPSMILGVCASIIPFPDHNQSPRNTYQSAMGKQAMGVFLTNFDQRMETMANILYYPQKPLARTMAMDYLKFRELPAGQNAIVAIACYSGYNQEDSVIMNQSSIDRGLFRSLFYRTYQAQEKMVGPENFERFEKPNRSDTLRMKHGTYDKIDEDGIIIPGLRVSGEDIIMGKVAPLAADTEELGQRTKTQTKRDASVTLRSTESGVVDQVMLTTTGDGSRFAKVRVRTTKVPQIGDKFASRHGQKGTIGITYRQEDMPFTRQGIVPDLIINPHAIPSRMTIAHLVECQLSKVATLKGDEGDATPFTKVTVTQISDILRSQGYQSRGFEVMYNGHTGRKLVAQVFLGPTYYQRLRHMVDDKIHSRARGPTQILTRQPVEGRARDGGLRFGEMERDCMIAHGASSFLKERLFDVSDPFRVHVCDICGLMTVVAKLKKNTFECKNCNNKNKISQVYLPYAAKLLFQELWSMNIAARLYTRKGERA